MNTRAYLVVTLDAATRQIVRVGIYSSPASNLTGMRGETMLDGPHADDAGGYEKAHARLVKGLREHPQYQWLYELLSPGDRTLGAEP